MCQTQAKVFHAFLLISIYCLTSWLHNSLHHWQTLPLSTEAVENEHFAILNLCACCSFGEVARGSRGWKLNARQNLTPLLWRSATWSLWFFSWGIETVLLPAFHLTWAFRFCESDSGAAPYMELRPLCSQEHCVTSLDPWHHESNLDTGQHFTWAAACPALPPLKIHTKQCHSTPIFGSSEPPCTYPASASLVLSQETAACSHWRGKTVCGPLHIGTWSSTL